METTLLMFLGVTVSAVVQIIKKYLKTNTLWTLVSVLGLAVACAVGVEVLTKFGLMDSFISILTTAGAFYAFIIRNIEKGSENK